MATKPTLRQRLCLVAGLCAAACVSVPLPAAAQQASADTTSCIQRDGNLARPRIGLALGGGGARGMSHVRILKKLETLGIPVDCIAGTSAGALIGAMYASGRSTDEIEQLILTTDWKDVFNDALPRRDRSLRRKAEDTTRLTQVGIGFRSDKGVGIAAGVSEGAKLLALFERATGSGRVSGRFDDLPIPFRAVATDINTGKPVVIDHGSLPMAMRASMSLPAIFQPVAMEGKILLDGGVSDQIPIDVVRAMGAQRIIAVDVGTPLSVLDRSASIVEVLDQLSGFLTTGSAARQLETLGPDDLVIRPDLDDRVATGDFQKAALALEIGQAAADAATPALRSFVYAPPAHATTPRPVPVPPDPEIAFVHIVNHTDYADDLLLSYLPVTPGQRLDTGAMQAGIMRAYGLGTLASITYEVKRENGQVGVEVVATPKPNGPAYLEAGLTLSNDLQGNRETNLRAGVLFAPLSPYGAEARVVLQLGSEPGLTGEYYHPFDLANRYAASVQGGYQSRSFNVFDAQGYQVERYRLDRYGVSAFLFRNFSNVLSIGVGAERYAGSARVEIGDPAVRREDFQDGAVRVVATLDDIDSLFFPRDGVLARFGLRGSRDWMGADAEFDQIDFDAYAAKSFGRHAVQLGSSYHVTASGEAPLQSIYRLGGRWRLAGFQHNQLTGKHYALVFAGYTYELANFRGRSAQVGGTLEYGNAWQRRSDMDLDDGILNASVFIGFDSWIGPLIFGIGDRKGSDPIIFVELGQGL
ncbi:patatin-like phospholipase family protein [Pseudoxanthomonas sp. SL93]|uniref:patatin-like phospholipase family protein n=1 Tax=Pseudoxanthomonas sp. SL93 TaxID=2995142 RepID=UPI00226F5F30|nr:patatin-like phospholipase family protein [Pseudoxanthomonas sp. SL93]WAC64001.1 patatin-like phospholipase family protein [Pseudoxanthomonas sp. SL93]